MTGRLLTTRELASYLGVSSETVLRRWRAGELPGFRLASNVLRFRESEIEAWLEGRRSGSPATTLHEVVARQRQDAPGRGTTIGGRDARGE